MCGIAGVIDQLGVPADGAGGVDVVDEVVEEEDAVGLVARVALEGAVDLDAGFDEAELV